MKTQVRFNAARDTGAGDLLKRLPGTASNDADRAGSGGGTTADFLRVPSIEECVERIKELGGSVIVPKKAVPGAGYFAVCLDAEKRAFGLWQDEKRSA